MKFATTLEIMLLKKLVQDNSNMGIFTKEIIYDGFIYLLFQEEGNTTETHLVQYNIVTLRKKNFCFADGDHAEHAILNTLRIRK